MKIVQTSPLLKQVIFYGLAGEGLGHAIRTQAVVESLSPDYEVHLFTYGDAYKFFAKSKYPHLHFVKGITFARNNDGKIKLFGTVLNFFDYLRSLKKEVRYVHHIAKMLNPCVFVSDFEGILPLAAKKYGKPLISIDNQHKFSRCHSRDIGLSPRLRLFSAIMGWYAEWLCPEPDKVVVSTFYHSDIKKKYCDKTVLTNCFVRKQIEETPPVKGDYILVYYKVSVGPKILKELAKTKEKVIVYNCPKNEQIFSENFEYREINNNEFVDALANCKAIFCAAGNQLLGEAIYYNKPIFAIPEPFQAEQEINAYYLVKGGYGMSSSLNEFDCYKLNYFLTQFKPKQHSSINGVEKAVEEIYSLTKTNSIL